MSLPPTKILVPVDTTAASRIAWKRAANLAERFGASVEGVFVQQLAYVVGGLGFGPTETGMLMRAGPETLAELEASLGGYAKVRALSGMPAEEITAFAGKNGFDLIVMGTHGRRGLERAVLGSVAEDVARLSSVPVLIVRSPISNVSGILAPLNEAEHSKEGLRAAEKAAELFKRKLRLLRVEKGDPAKGIADAARARDLIVLVSRPGKGLRERVLGSTPQRLLRMTGADVLVFPASAPAQAPRRQTADPLRGRGRGRARAKQALRKTRRQARLRRSAAPSRPADR